MILVYFVFPLINVKNLRFTKYAYTANKTLKQKPSKERVNVTNKPKHVGIVVTNFSQYWISFITLNFCLVLIGGRRGRGDY